MQPTITARHFDLSPRIRDHAITAVSGLTKFFENIVSGDITITLEKNRYTAEIRLTVYHDLITASATGHDLFPAIDQATDKARAQLLRYKGKLKDRSPEEITELSISRSRPNSNEDELDV